MSIEGRISAEARAKLQRLREEYSDFLCIAQTLPEPIRAIARFIEVAIEDEVTMIDIAEERKKFELFFEPFFYS